MHLGKVGVGFLHFPKDPPPREPGRLHNELRTDVRDSAMFLLFVLDTITFFAFESIYIAFNARKYLSITVEQCLTPGDWLYVSHCGYLIKITPR